MRFSARSYVLSWMIVGVSGCAGAGRGGDGEPVVGIAQEVVPTAMALANNLVLASNVGGLFEDTAKVVPPSTRPMANCSNGGIGVVTGQTPTEFASRPLVDALGKIDFSTTSSTTPFPSIANTLIGTDNQIVRMKDGSLLAVKGGVSWATSNPALLYANELVNNDVAQQHLGARGGNMYFFRSTDCGATWSAWGTIDFGTFAGGNYGFPRPAALINGQFTADVACANQGTDPSNGKLMWWIGGADRPELYACPFTGNVYLTVHVVSGPFCNSGGRGGPTSQISTDLLMMSTDGKTWSLVTSTLPAVAPVVMTSTPNGRLFLLDDEGGVPTVRFSTQPVQPGISPQIGTGWDASFKDNGSSIAISTSSQARGHMMIQSDQNPTLAVNAAGGAAEGTQLKMSSICSADNPSCTWTYRNGLLLSDADPTLAITAGSIQADPTNLTLTRACNSTKPECTWTYKKGEFFSDKAPTWAMNAWRGASNGASVVLTSLCVPANSACTWTLPHVELSSGTTANLRISPSGTGANAVPLTLSATCLTTNPDCTWTIKKGMIKSDRDASLAFNAAGGVKDSAVIKLSNICSDGDSSCTWTWTKGEIVSDGSGATPLPINASGGARPGATLLLNSVCSAANMDCLFAAFNEAVQLGRSEQISVNLSRVSTDVASSKVRLVYPSLNGDNMQDARVVNFDATNPASPVANSLTTVRADRPQDHSVMFTTFVDPDYIDMPGDDRSNTSLLYWEEAPTPSATQTYAARYVTISGDSDVSSSGFLSVAGGTARTWSNEIDLGDYTAGGFFWRNKTFNYLAQWVDTDGTNAHIESNIVTINSPTHGFMIQSDRNSGLAFNAAGGAVVGANLKMSSICSVSDASCTWSYRSGMIVSDANPNLAINAWGGAAEGTQLRLSDLCVPSNPDCTWTYKNGEFLSDRNPALAVNAWGGAVNGATLLLTGLCDPTNPDCTWTLPHVELSSAQDTRLGVNAAGGAANAVPLLLSSACTATNTDCAWTFSKGMIKSDTNSSLAVNAAGGATNLATVKLSNICSANNLSCLWTWTKGEIVSDGSGGTPLAINASGGAVPGAALIINSACSQTNNDCVFAGYFAP